MLRYTPMVLVGSILLAGCQPDAQEEHPADGDAVFKVLDHPSYNELVADLKMDQTVSDHPGDTALQTCLTTASESVPAEPDLTLWVKADKGYNGMQKVANCYEEATGVSIAVEAPENVTVNFQQQASIGQGPDIMIWGHDRFGDWAESDLIAGVSPATSIRNSIPQFMWDAMLYNGLEYGYPLAIEGSALVVNNALLSKNEIDLFSHSLGNTHPVMWDYNNSYFSYGWLSAQSGYAFNQTETGWDITDVGVDDPGFISQGELLGQLVAEGHIPQGVDYTTADQAFLDGETAMVLSGPWSLDDYSEAGIDYSVRSFSINGNRVRPYSTILAATINKTSASHNTAAEFIEQYLMSEAGLAAINADRPLGVPANIGYLEAFADDDTIIGLANVFYHSQPIPNLPEMGRYWSNMGPALTAVTEGRSTAQTEFTVVKLKMLE